MEPGTKTKYYNERCSYHSYHSGNDKGFRNSVSGTTGRDQICISNYITTTVMQDANIGEGEVKGVWDHPVNFWNFCESILLNKKFQKWVRLNNNISGCPVGREKYREM